MNPEEAFPSNREELPHTSGHQKPDGKTLGQTAPEIATREIETPKTKFNWRSLSLIGVSFGLISLYGLSRPCVIGECEAITQAQLVQSLPQEPTDREIQAFHKQLVHSVTALESIPAWSSYRTEAKTLRLNHRRQLETVTHLVAALASEAEAKEQLQTPQSASAANIRAQWQQAIASLKQIPPDSELYDFAQSKIEQDRQNLVATNRRLKAQSAAIKRLKQAQEAAKLAQSRSLAARSLSDWRLVVATWDTGIKRLQEISPDTASYPESQELLAEYRTRLAAARKRQQQEQLAQDKLHQGAEQAQQAKESEAINQWTAAVTHWRHALSAVRQVPQNTSEYSQAQSLLDSYTAALNQAQAQLQTALTLQQTRRDLEKVCSGTTKICNYAVKDREIQVNLTATYMEEVRQTALQAKAQGDLQAQVNLLDHIASVEQGLEAISNNTDLRVGVYDSQGTLLVNYQPRS